MPLRHTEGVQDRLIKLGLTNSEAKAYLAVAKLGLCRVVELAREAHLQRTENYRLMKGLVEKGLVHESLDRPRRYGPVDFAHAIPQLTKQILAELNDIANQSKQLVAALEKIGTTTLGPNTEPLVTVVNGGDAIRRNFLHLIEMAKQEVWFVGSVRAMAPASNLVTSRTLTILKTNGVRARAIVEVDKSNLKKIQKLAGIMEVRYFQPLSVHVYGIDDHCAAVGLTPLATRNLNEASELLVTHRPWVQMMRQFFEALWNQSIPLQAQIAIMGNTNALAPRTTVIWGRGNIHKQVADWHSRAKNAIMDIGGIYAPSGLLDRFKDGYVNAHRRGVKMQMICHVSKENRAAIKELSRYVEIRHTETPFAFGVGILDESEAILNYIYPDSPSLQSSATDIAICTTDTTMIRNMLEMFNYVWSQSKPLDDRLREIPGGRRSAPL